MDNQERFLPNRQVAERYGKSTKTVTRWAADPTLNFPPAIIINGREHRALSKLEAWERERAAIAAKAPRKHPPNNRE
jgi:predicted DNA-binding transcriptional regulator AlpA